MRTLTPCILLPLAAFFTFVDSQCAASHDLSGLLSEQNIPDDVKEALRNRARLRNPALAKHLMEQVVKGKQATAEEETALSELGLPRKFETALESIFLADARWDRGSEISVCFFDGTQVARKNVIEVALEIFALAGLSVNYGTIEDIRTCDVAAPSLVRVAFSTDGYWSYIGTDTLTIPPNLPTLGLENYHLFPSLSPNQKGVVKHEFMHAIGALHDHQHSQSNCNAEFNWDIIYTSIPWPKEQIDFNMKPISELPGFAGLNVVEGAYDRTSIMHYDLPAHYFKDASKATCYVPENNVLSDEDRRMVRAMYID